MRENRGPWYLLTGLIIGLAAGLGYAWWIEPVQYIRAGPNSLSAAAKAPYRAMIALAYQADGNLGRARQRLALLNDSSPAQALQEQAQQVIDPFSVEGKALAALAESYHPKPTLPATMTATLTTLPQTPTRSPSGALSPTATLDPAQAVRTATRPPTTTSTVTATVAPTPIHTPTPRATLRPTFTPGAPFTLKEKVRVCDAALPGMLQVEVFDSAGKAVPGVQILVTWPPANQERFFTGLSPEISLGYADFQMTGKVVYSVQAGENGEAVNGVTTQDCVQPTFGTYPGGWKITFIQP